MNHQKSKNSQDRAILLLVIRLILSIACQIAESGWWQDGLSSHPESTKSEIMERNAEQGSCDIHPPEDQ